MQTAKGSGPHAGVQGQGQQASGCPLGPRYIAPAPRPRTTMTNSSLGYQRLRCQRSSLGRAPSLSDSGLLVSPATAREAQRANGSLGTMHLANPHIPRDQLSSKFPTVRGRALPELHRRPSLPWTKSEHRGPAVRRKMVWTEIRPPGHRWPRPAHKPCPPVRVGLRTLRGSPNRTLNDLRVSREGASFSFFFHHPCAGTGTFGNPNGCETWTGGPRPPRQGSKPPCLSAPPATCPQHFERKSRGWGVW